MTADDKRRARRIVHLCTPARVGGLERVVQALGREQAARGHDVTVLAVVGDPADAEAFFAPFAGSAVRTVTLRLGGREYRRERRLVQAQLAERRAEVLHTHGYRADLLHGGPTRRAGIATVSTVHGSSRMGGLSHLFEWLQLRALRSFDAVVAVSSPLERTLRAVGVPAATLHRIPNVVPATAHALAREAARRALGLPEDHTTVLGWVGRVVPVKALDVFLRAFAQLPAGAALASIIGDGPDRAPMQALAAELGLGERVRFHGELPDSALLLAAFDGFVLSSRSEGTPIVVLEAMRAGLPVVATAVGGVPDVVQDGVTGWLVPSEDPPALAAALGALVADPGAGRTRGAAGLDRLRREFDPGVWVDRYDAAYGSAIGRRSRH
ncbi:MAG: glycosyltransferase family 4 protein [Gemmatimonadaceae bacterium]|nr:glycosyltransferase family 4 protein [Gemmatimonadaceae bacterium]